MVTFNLTREEMLPTYYFYVDEIDKLWHSEDDCKYYQKDRNVDFFGFYEYISKLTKNINSNIISLINLTNITSEELRSILINEYGDDSSFELISESYSLLTDEELF